MMPSLRASRLRSVALHTAAALGGLGLCFWLTSGSTNSWDTLEHYQQSRWILAHLGLLGSHADPAADPAPVVQYYGPLWEAGLGICTERLFGFLREPGWVRNAMGLLAFPVSLYLFYRMLRGAAVPAAGGALAVAMLFGVIRLGGHAATNPKDFPLAMGFLLAAVFQWRWIGRQRALPAGRRFGWGALLSLGTVSIAPYLLRPPLLAHFGIGLAIPPVCARLWREKLRVRLFLVPALAGLAWCFLLYVPFREHGWEGLAGSVRSFSRFAPGSDFVVRYFGTDGISRDLPWWYALIWPPVAFHPLVLIATVAGLVLAARELVRKPGGLLAWLALYAAIAWGAVLLLHPVLYNEDRHLLFLYPPLIGTAALGLGTRLRPRWLAGLAAAIALGAGFSYASWGRYSYVYESPLIGSRGDGRFSGDYWGLCAPLAMQQLSRLVPPGSPILLDIPMGIAALERERLRGSLLHRDPEFQDYKWFVNPAEMNGRYFVLSFNENGRSRHTLRDVREGRARLLWENWMPPDEQDCVLTEYR